jgi:hypothetical protein
VARLIMNELSEPPPVLFVQASNVVSVNVGEVSFIHGNCPATTYLLDRFY